jgi:Holliday junction resolvase
MKESLLQKKILAHLDSIGGFTVKTIQSNKRGIPDIVACINGRFYAIEVKAAGKLSTLTPIQKYQLRKITEAGGIAFPADSLDTVIENLKKRKI